MKKLTFLFIIGIVTLGIMTRCATDKQPLPSNAHPENWRIANAPQGHGTKLFALGLPEGLASCVSCHGTDFTGGPSGVSCYRCHATFPHVAGWPQRGSGQFHGAYLSQSDYDLHECAPCHGEGLQGGDLIPSCYRCHALYPHSGEWTRSENSQFHGAYVKSRNWQLDECASCHGTDFQGGGYKSSCYACHPAYPHVDNWSHSHYLRQQGHQLKECQTCHGADYRGEEGVKNCRLCHSDPAGPERCNLCHGSSLNNAPPKDTQGNTSESAIGVGKHQLHVVTLNYNCGVCHRQPSTFAADGHVYNDATPGRAEVNEFWQYDQNAAVCVTACHTNPNKTYIWNR